MEKTTRHVFGRLKNGLSQLRGVCEHIAIGGTVTSAKFKFCTLKYRIRATEKAAILFLQHYFMKVSTLLLKFNSRR